MDRYDHSIRTRDPLGSRLFIQNFNFSGTELNFDLKEVMIPPALVNGFLSENYWEHPQHKDEAYKIDVFELNSFEDATMVLEDLLQHHMNPDLSPWDDKPGYPGEIAFGGMTHVLFTRANLVNVINSIGNKDIDVSVFATELDALFTSIPDLKENENPGLIPRLRLVSKDAKRYEFQLEKGEAPYHRGVWFKYVAQGGSIRRENGQITVTKDNIDFGVTIYAYLGIKAIEKMSIRI